MSADIELLSDGKGLAVLGSPTDVDRFLVDQGLSDTPAERLDLSGLGQLLGFGASAVEVAGHFYAHSGRWLPITPESAQAVKEFGLMPTKSLGISHAMIGKPGDIQQWLQVDNSVLLAGGPILVPMIATVMSQQALQRQIKELESYLEAIDEKVDDILRSLKDAVLAEMVGADLTIEEAMTVRERVGRVSEVTWSKVQATSMAIAKTQAYAIRQLDALAERLEKKADIGDLEKATREVEPKLREWLAVLARSFQLSDGAAILELDRVLHSAPEELDRHRVGLEAARQDRLALMSRTTARLLKRMDKTITLANQKVLLNPFDAPAAVRASNRVAIGVLEFRDRVGVESDYSATDAKRWRQAAVETRDKVFAAGADGAAAAKRLGDESFSKATEAFRAVDIDGDGIPDKPRAAAAAEEAGAALKDAAAGVAGAFGTLFQRKRAARPAEDTDASPEITSRPE